MNNELEKCPDNHDGFSMKIAVSLIGLFLVHLRVWRASPWIGPVAPHRGIQVGGRSEPILIECVSRLNEAAPGQEAVTPLQT